jgi:hypothetical protein
MGLRDVFKEMRKSVDKKILKNESTEPTEVYTDTFSNAINNMIDQEYEDNLKKSIMSNVKQEDLHQEFLDRIEKTKNETIKAMNREVK